MTFSPSWSLTNPGTKLAAVTAAGTFVESGGSSQWHTTAGAPVWSTPPVLSTQPKLDANGDTLAVLRFEMASPTASRIPTLRRYRPSGPSPSVTYQFPLTVQNASSAVHVSRDGQRTVAWVFSFQAKPAINPSPSNGQVVDVAVFNGTNEMPSRMFSVYMSGEPSSSALSADGSRLLLVSSIKHVLIDVNAGTFIVDGYNTSQPGQACALSADGTSWAIARSSGAVDVVRGAVRSVIEHPSKCMSIKLGANTVTGWFDGTVKVDSISIPTPSPLLDMDVSPDGNVIAAISGGVTILERVGSAFTKTFEQQVVGATDVDAGDQFVSVTAGTKVEVFKRGAAASPTAYVATIPAALAISGSEHDALAVPPGSGPAKRVRVL